VRRTHLNDAFRESVEKAGLAQDKAVAEIYQQTSRSDGELDLYCNGKLFERWKIRRFLRFKLGDNEIVVNGQIGLGWGRVDHVYVLELDADQVEAWIAKLTEPKPRRGRPPEDDFSEKVKAEKQRRRETGEKTSHGELAQHFRVSKWAIGRALRKK
jgi:hypothetical protein